MHMKNLHAQAYVIPTIHKEKKKCTIVLLPYPSGHWNYILKWNIFESLVGFEVCKYAQDKIVSPTICGGWEFSGNVSGLQVILVAWEERRY